ncbi:hypothetical protein [Rhizorhabdus dicambivorans]|uniref:Uncharacterized protein n=1 Tax=Rhizorhabdus dicambivorans TaxID=1850238 RepID=A0A2A4FYM3_9SPHN|nr:hypothetical protein [Rhizorhabdus dicambivorans]ATE64125.1 hypothetical protein CMV14_06755 [Rhizorhabdus dicambivorans]PCE42604.1 hypothetical protein COO09_09325 [Rhizorhabdus dicambivorans]
MLSPMGVMTIVIDGATDWAATGQMLSGVGTVLGALAVIYAAKVGADTFSSWKRQKLEERRIAVAEQALALAFRIEEAFEQIRYPSATATEQAAAFENMIGIGLIDDRTPIEIRSRLLPAQVAVDRINATSPLFLELSEVMPLTRAFLHRDVAEHLVELRQHRQRITHAALELLQNARHAQRAQTENQREREEKWRNEREAIVISDEDRLDVFRGAINNCVARLDGQLGPIVRIDINVRQRRFQRIAIKRR